MNLDYFLSKIPPDNVAQKQQNFLPNRIPLKPRRVTTLTFSKKCKYTSSASGRLPTSVSAALAKRLI